MENYYNFKISENEISYDPYWYENSNLLISFTIGIIIIAGGIILLEQNHLQIVLPIASAILFFVILSSLYHLLIRSKTTLVFDKNKGILFKITPLGKKKITLLNNVMDVVSKSSSNSFNYILTVQKRNSVVAIKLTPRIRYKEQDNPEVRFLQMEILPQLELFLGLNKKITAVFDSEETTSL
ncbi:hypothetical protein [Flavobacterium hungaricum]|uniref:Uncharacterized protein n=1 Tax=Flavobacterium hungaricum TaxID=2082725 RepID=A0ABR9TKE8_9FLAO|nr:hypothetical protein [Flavobacterium hungaricum]MBE8725835.1 hypothetical protein [Flavobacterium hungaricum]